MKLHFHVEEFRAHLTLGDEGEEHAEDEDQEEPSDDDEHDQEECDVDECVRPGCVVAKLDELRDLLGRAAYGRKDATEALIRAEAAIDELEEKARGSEAKIAALRDEVEDLRRKLAAAESKAAA